MKKWECTVCGYIHEGEQPPDACPICGAGAEYFKEIVEKKEQQGASAQPEEQKDSTAGSGDKASKAQDRPSALVDLVLRFHLHPISVHTPNGALPIAFVFLALAMVFGLAGFEQAAFYIFAFVLIAMPVVLLTGYLEWQNRYHGAKTKIFITKIIASSIATLSLLVMVVWRLVDPDVAASASGWIYLLIGGVMVAAVGLAGNMGGKLVFGGRRR